MIGLLKTLRKLVLGETWVLPIAVAVAVGVTALVRAAAGPHGWWRHGGGFVLLAGVLVAFAVSTHVARRVRARRSRPATEWRAEESPG